MKKRIVFVDDEVKLLQGLRRMLRSMRKEWDMEFLPSGREALEFLENTPADVIVSDMRMPGMDGVEFLGRIKKLYPAMIRIALSGYSEMEMTVRSVGTAHQFLAKPCEPEKLVEAINRASSLRQLLDNDALVSLVGDIEALPSLPSLYTEVMNEINSPEGSLKKVGAIISRDVGMSAKVLQLVNSAFFGLPQHVESPSQAVNLLGFDIIRALVLSVHVFSEFQSELIEQFPLDSLMDHSMAVGVLSQKIARHEGLPKKDVDDAFLAGMLHDLGKLILVANLPGEYMDAVRQAKESKTPLYLVERRALGSSHAEVGAYLLGLWGLNDSIIEGVAYHHMPQHAMARGFTPLASVYAANILVNREKPMPNFVTDTSLDMEYLAGLECENESCVDHLSTWMSLRDETISE